MSIVCQSLCWATLDATGRPCRRGTQNIPVVDPASLRQSEDPMIEESALLEAVMETRQQIDYLWNFFVSVHIAIFALLFIYDQAVESMNYVAKALGFIGIAIFDYINGKALQNTYLLLDALHDQYRAVYGQVERFQPMFYERFVLSSFQDRPSLVLLTHGMAFLVVTLAFASRRFIQSNRSFGRRPVD